jgi:hypothetical protein
MNFNTLYVLSTHDSRLLTEFFNNLLLHFACCHSGSRATFLNNLHIIGDCYRLILVNSGKEIATDENLKIFTHYFALAATPLETKKVACTMTEMIDRVADQIRLLSFPWFYSVFFSAVEDLLSDKWAYFHPSLQARKHFRSKLLPNHYHLRRTDK